MHLANAHSPHARRRKNASALPGACAIALLLTSCLGGTAEDTFIAGANEVICDEVIPACQGEVGGCILDENGYLRGNFPGTRKFIVETPSGDWRIIVKIFLAEQFGPGDETSIRWFEPGCVKQYSYNSATEGDPDLFTAAGRDRVFQVEETVSEGGDHLIEVFSDSTARYVIRVEVTR